jgi:hypothetical protein
MGNQSVCNGPTPRTDHISIEFSRRHTKRKKVSPRRRRRRQLGNKQHAILAIPPPPHKFHSTLGISGCFYFYFVDFSIGIKTNQNCWAIDGRWLDIYFGSYCQDRRSNGFFVKHV